MELKADQIGFIGDVFVAELCAVEEAINPSILLLWKPFTMPI